MSEKIEVRSAFGACEKRLHDDVLPRLKGHGLQELLAQEIHSRLRQLDMLVSLVDEAMDKMTVEMRSRNLASHDIMIKANLFAEAFYLFAFRVIDITRLLNKRPFGRRKLAPEPRGVITIRNLFIVHPERSTSPILSHNLMFSSFDRNVYIKGARPVGENDDLRDLGFRENLAEFVAFIEAWIDAAAIQQISTPAPPPQRV
jgi:hypothetical protein